MIETIITGQTILTDDQDRELLSRYPWTYSKMGGLQYKSDNGDTIIFSRLVMNCSGDLEVDHINRNRWDNRRANLRLATREQNIQNRGKFKTNSGVKCSSIYKGVSWKTSNQNWVAQIQVHGSKIHLGYFYHEVDAAHVYNEAAKKYFKDFAVLNMKDGKVL